MLTKYIEAAMRRAEYEWLAEDRVHYGQCPDLQGVWASGKTQEECTEVLREVVEEWVMPGLRYGHEFPVVDGVELKFREVSRVGPGSGGSDLTRHPGLAAFAEASAFAKAPADESAHRPAPEKAGGIRIRMRMRRVRGVFAG